MTRLECTAAACLHNAEKCCCRREIFVGGDDACRCGDTCCTSFEENQGGVFKNLFKTPEKKLSVECGVRNCLYNDDRLCRAERIAILGDGAREPGQTECAGFRAVLCKGTRENGGAKDTNPFG